MSEKNDIHTLPVGRVINHSLFVRDAYNDKAKPSYKVELAFEKDSTGIIAFDNLLREVADAKWGAGAGDDEDLVIPILDGEKLKKKREKKGKEGDAYAGMEVIRASTIYNKDGIEGPGGIQVFDEDAELLTPARQGEVYQGCYGIAAVTVGTYETDDGANGLKLYLTAFQKTSDGERLVSASDRSSLFKPVGREGAATRTTRRRRRG